MKTFITLLVLALSSSCFGGAHSVSIVVGPVVVGGPPAADNSWPCTDSAATTVVVADIGAVNGTLAGSGNTVDAQTGTGFQLGTSGGVYAAVPDYVTSGDFTFQLSMKYVNTPDNQWPRFFSNNGGTNEVMAWWDTSTQKIKLYANGASGESTSTIDLTDGVKRVFRFVWTSADHTLSAYIGTTEANLASFYAYSGGTQPNAWGGTTYFGYAGGANSFRGEISGIKVWNSAVAP